MHSLRTLIRQIDKTHKGLGAMVAVNLLCAKSKVCLLNISPAGCGKSVATDTIHRLLLDQATKYTSLTLAGLKHIAKKLSFFAGHLIIDDLGTEKSLWSRVSTITVLANLVHTHHVHKITQSYEIQINDFNGSASLNIQPVLMNSLVMGEEWISVVRDKVLRYYHLIRPIQPRKQPPDAIIEWGEPLSQVKYPSQKGASWYQLVAVGLTQWSFARCLEHLPQLLRGIAALDSRTSVQQKDYSLLGQLLMPMQLERYILQSYGFETGRVFKNNVYCILVELASHGNPTIQTICEDYKVSPTTVERLIQEAKEWAWIKSNSPKKVMPTQQTTKILELAGVNQKW